ncbi:hypothetical protein HWV62_40130 [Athelia sp. TMB]|nr:hypothetical protein HWV62_40130 [Athelia sp. TMB]
MAFAARAARLAMRTSVRSVPAVRTRAMSSTGHAAKKGSDTTWIIGSAVVFIPTEQDAHAHGHAAEHHEEHALTEAEPVKDSDGTEASAEEISKSEKQAFDTDSPADAQAAEEHHEKYANGAPGQTEESEVDQDQEVGKGRSGGKKGTFQKDEDEGPRPTDMSDARKLAKDEHPSKEAPVTAKDDHEGSKDEEKSEGASDEQKE